MRIFKLLSLLSLMLALALLPGHALADDDDHDLARAALERGEIKPLSDILATVQKEHPGDILEVEFERDDGLWLYEVKTIDKSGRLLKIYVDAARNTIIRVKTKNAHSDR